MATGTAGADVAVAIGALVEATEGAAAVAGASLAAPPHAIKLKVSSARNTGINRDENDILEPL